ncbi:hypothetical protein JBL43_03195 [Aureibaculum sp. A20]|uniref:DUF4296 domain-containing protein n=1 Tax=Aureibaculum flavum TaxID=2795986 RepID=A0ABS0WMM8_9FLAO|nr:hypothetical protein [Aureibaculum flavum]MBJ2173225.1 hypothetical protein [Aureibaculum flavum]
MKTLHILIAILSLSIFNASYAQAKKDTTTTEKKSVQNDNFLDMGAKSLTQVFGENLDGNTSGKKLNFLEMLKKMNLPTEQKEEYRNLYYLQAKDLTQKQKDSLGRALGEKIKEAQLEKEKE